MSEDKGSNMMWQVISYNYYKNNWIELNWNVLQTATFNFLTLSTFQRLKFKKKKGLSKEVVLQLLLEYF